MDAGHYINRKHLSTRWNEKNVHAQCRACNRFDEGNMLGYTKGLIKKYGTNIIDLLEISKNQTLKINDFEAKALINHYKKEVEKLER